MVTVMETKRPSLLGCFFTGSSLKGATWRATISATASWKPGSSLPMIFTGKVVGNLSGDSSLISDPFRLVFLEQGVHALPPHAGDTVPYRLAVHLRDCIDLTGGADQPDLLGPFERSDGDDVASHGHMDAGGEHKHHVAGDAGKKFRAVGRCH